MTKNWKNLTRLRDPGQCRIVRLTKTMIPRLVEVVRDEDKDRIFFTDALMPGHKIAVSRTSHVTFLHQWTHWHEGKRVDKIGTFPGITPDQSREIIGERNVMIARRIDPNIPPTEEVPRISAFTETEFISSSDKKYKNPATVRSQCGKWVFNFFIGPMDKPLDQIERRDVVQFIEWVAEHGSEVTANRLLSLLSSIFRRAIDLGIVEHNPCRGVKKFPEPDSRDRVASDEEFERFIRVIKRRIEHPHVKILFLLTLLSLRLSEVLEMRWSRIDLQRAQYTIEKPKNGRRRVISLNPLALGLLREMHQEREPENDWVFPAYSESGRVVNIRPVAKSVFEEAELHAFRIHDIRRTAASILLNDCGASLASIKEILGHSDIRSTLVYARLSAKSMAKTSRLLAEKVQEVSSD